MHRARLILLVLPLLGGGASGCATLHLGNLDADAVRAVSPERCQQLDDRVVVLHAVAIALGGVGAVLAPLSGTTSSVTTKSFLLSGASLGTLASTVAGYLAGKYSSDFTKECP